MITKEQLQKIISEEKQKLLNENVPSALGMEILSIKDALFDILMGVRTLAADAGHGEDLAEDLEMQIERLREIGYKKA
jgi:phage terminase small subunit